MGAWTKPPSARPASGFVVGGSILLSTLLILLEVPAATAQVVAGANVAFESVCEKSAENPPLVPGEYYNMTGPAQSPDGGYDGSVILADDPSNTGSDNVTFGLREPFVGIQISINTAGASGSITWKYSTATGWNPLTLVSDPTNNFRNVGSNAIRFAAPSDWAMRTWKCTDARPMYYVMAQSAQDYTVQPLSDQLGAIVLNLKLRVLSEAGEPITGLGQSHFRVDGGSVNSIVAFRVDGGGDYSLALDAMGADRDFTVRVEPSGYVQSATLATGTMTKTPRILTSSPMQPLYPIKVIVKDDKGEPVPSATVTWSNQPPKISAGTSAHYFLGTTAGRLAVAALGYEPFDTAVDTAALSVVPGVTGQTLITLGGAIPCAAGEQIAAGTTAACSGLKRIPGSTSAPRTPGTTATPRNPASSIVTTSTSVATTCQQSSLATGEDGLYSQVSDRVLAGGLLRVCLDPLRASGIEQVELTARSDLSGVEARIETSPVLKMEWADGGPVRAPGKAAFAFFRLEILSDGASVPSAASGAKVRFHVSQQAMQEAGVRADEVRLYQWGDQAWTALPTQFVLLEGDDATFTATTAGAGTFAVAAANVAPATSGGSWMAWLLGASAFIACIVGGLWIHSARAGRKLRRAQQGASLAAMPTLPIAPHPPAGPVRPPVIPPRVPPR